ncbi:MAG TPA: GDP-mannose 4,6-dehydratase [Ignavibacteria bacterium]|nr:GDP-mannose 4,6-dehydratase [Ignavibacteria bacterium]
MAKVLVTGAGGFIGSALTESLVRNGYDVKAFVRYNSANSRGWLENSEFRNEIEIISGDIRDYDSVYKAMSGCGSVFHLAALIGIPYSYVSPLAYIKTNIEGTYNVLESSKNLNLENIIITSTSETYGTAKYVPINENHPLLGQSPYSASKIAADNLALSYYLSFGTPVKVVRPFNTYGPRQSARAVIPSVIIQALKGGKLKIGNTAPTRDFTFVEDTVSGFISIFTSGKLTGEVTNIGSNFEISVRDLIAEISSLLNVELTADTDNQRIRPEKSEVERLWCDNTKIIENTDWRPRVGFREGLKKTIAWLKENTGFYKSDIYNV